MVYLSSKALRTLRYTSSKALRTQGIPWLYHPVHPGYTTRYTLVIPASCTPWLYPPPAHPGYTTRHTLVIPPVTPGYTSVPVLIGPFPY